MNNLFSGFRWQIHANKVCIEFVIRQKHFSTLRLLSFPMAFHFSHMHVLVHITLSTHSLLTHFLYDQTSFGFALTHPSPPPQNVLGNVWRVSWWHHKGSRSGSLGTRNNVIISNRKAHLDALIEPELCSFYHLIFLPFFSIAAKWLEIVIYRRWSVQTEILLTQFACDVIVVLRKVELWFVLLYLLVIINGTIKPKRYE